VLLYKTTRPIDLLHYFKKKKRDDGLPDLEGELSAEILSCTIAQANVEVRWLVISSKEKKRQLCEMYVIFMHIF